MVKRLARCIVAFPWLWLGSIYATWLVALASLGRRPRPLLDDPNHLSSAVVIMHRASVLLLLLLLALWLASLVAALALSGLRRVPWKAALTFWAASFASWLLALLYGRIDPGRVLAWFLD